MADLVRELSAIAAREWHYTELREEEVTEDFITSLRGADDKHAAWARLSDRDAALLDTTPHTTALVPLGYCVAQDLRLVKLEEVITRDGMTRSITYRCAECGHGTYPVAWKRRAVRA